jgi:hypothetical protein
MGSHGHGTGGGRGTALLAKNPRLVLALIPLALGFFLLGRLTSSSSLASTAGGKKARAPVKGASGTCLITRPTS